MKKILSFLLIFAFAFALCSCGSNTSKTNISSLVQTPRSENDLVGLWEQSVDVYGTIYQNFMEIRNDGTLTTTNDDICNYTIDDGVLHIEEIDDDTYSYNWYYRLSDDKNYLYLSYTKDSNYEEKYTRVDSSSGNSNDEDTKSSYSDDDKASLYGTWCEYANTGIQLAFLEDNAAHIINNVEQDDFDFINYYCHDGKLILVGYGGKRMIFRYQLLDDGFSLRLYDEDDENLTGDYYDFYKAQ